MTSLIESAKPVHDVESKLSYVEIVYEKFVRGSGYNTYVDYIQTEPLANWVTLESKTQSIPYEKFIDTMVEKTLEVRHKLAELAVENLLADSNDTNTYVRLMHACKILDPTFQPPRINVKSAWQRDFAKSFCSNDIEGAIKYCEDAKRLDYFFNVARNIGL